MYVYGVVDPESPEREKEEVKDRIGAMLISPLFLKAVSGGGRGGLENETELSCVSHTS